ncbi:TetR/AcrR family transcriptional regulator [Kitasatospora sp. NPDC057015]|uniref:TetR/AcrR family transcriptional regulator n=1 Tax=Kitasatospora sp. NPDC057015 TaxID=3346001 RepID=UPI00363DC3C6
MARRTQADRSESTTGDIVDAAIDLFGRDGYPAVSIDEIARAAGVTKGAVYHHFDGKTALLRAAFVHQEQRRAEQLTQAAAGSADALAAVRAGCAAFLRSCLDPAVRRILLLDGPAVLGWESVRAIEAEYSVALLRRGLGAAVAEGRLRPGDLDVRTHLLLGALCEAGMLLARAADAPTALAAVTREVDALLDAFAAPAGA